MSKRRGGGQQSAAAQGAPAPSQQPGTDEAASPASPAQVASSVAATDESDAEQAPDEPKSPDPNFVKCKAIRLCLVRGSPEYPGAVFWIAPDQAERLKGKGDLEIL